MSLVTAPCQSGRAEQSGNPLQCPLCARHRLRQLERWRLGLDSSSEETIMSAQAISSGQRRVLTVLAAALTIGGAEVVAQGTTAKTAPVKVGSAQRGQRYPGPPEVS